MASQQQENSLTGKKWKHLLQKDLPNTSSMDGKMEKRGSEGGVQKSNPV